MNDLKDALNRLADTSAPTSLSLERVRGRARQIRRRRTAAALVGSAAAVGLIAGLGVAVLPSNRGHDSVPPATQTPTATPTPTPTTDVQADEVGKVYDVRLDHLQAEQTFGDEPQVPYWFDGNLIDTSGSPTPFPDRPFTFARDPQTSGWAIVRAGEAHAELVHVDASGKQVGAALPSFEDGLAADGHGRLATISEGASGWTLSAGGQTFPLGRTVEWARIDGVLPSGDVVVDVDGTVSVAHVSDGRLTPMAGASTAVAGPGSALVAVASEGGTWTARTNAGDSAWTLDWAGVNSFSPDGRYVALVGDPQHRITGSEDFDSDHATGVIWIRDAATLAPVAAFKAPADGYFGGWTWDGDRLLATVYDRGAGEWSLVRLSADGFTVGRATAREGGGEEPSYVFAAE